MLHDDRQFPSTRTRERARGRKDGESYACLENGIDERREGGALRKNDQEAEEDQDNNHRDHPPEFPLPEEAQQLAENTELG